MSDVAFPAGYRLERLHRDHSRKSFRCGQRTVDLWFATKAGQHQNKHLSVTKVLIDPDDDVAGFYTLATGQVDFGDLPTEIAKRLPRRVLPVAVLARLGVSENRHGQGLGRLLLAQALRDCHVAGQTFAFVAVLLDCVDEKAKTFYQQWDFNELPGHPLRLYLGIRQLDAMMQGQ